MLQPTFVLRFLLAMSVGAATPALGQCSNPWVATPGSAGIEGSTSDLLVYDPDGSGPIGERVLVAGSFTIAGSVLASNLAIYDPALRTWSAFGPGPYPANLRLARATNGDVYAAGNFTSIAGVAAAGLARFDGTNWSSLPAGLVGNVWRIEAHPLGGVVVIGSLTQAGGAATNGIAWWDGVTWSSLSSTTMPPFLGSQRLPIAVAVHPNGTVFLSVQDSNANMSGVMRFDGTAWSSIGVFVAPTSLCVSSSGDLLAGGVAVPGGSVFSGQTVARWNGTNWSSLGLTPFYRAERLVEMPSGALAVLGAPSATFAVRTAIWDGTTWTTIGDGWSGLAEQDLAVLASGDLLVGGDRMPIGTITAAGVARWNGTVWSPASPGVAGSARWLAVRDDGGIFLGESSAAPDSCVQRWNGSAWSPVVGALAGGNETTIITGVFALPSHGLLLGARSQFNGPPGPIVQRWTGSAWTTLATSTFGRVEAATELANGELVVGGQFTTISGVAAQNVARYTGTAWVPLGAGVSQPVRALVASPNGDLWALAGPMVLRWNGTAWAQFGLAIGGVTALVLDAQGLPVVAGNLSGPDVLRWNGVAWAPVGNGPAGPVQSIVVLPDGDLVVGPLVDASNPARALERWNGASWSALGGAVDATVHALALAANGDLLLAGDFAVANGAPRGRFARITTSCPATVSSFAPGCNGTPIPFVARTLPWLGGTCRVAASNLQPDAMAVLVFGSSTTSVALSPLFGAASDLGCRLLVAPDVLLVQLPSNGCVQAEYAIPDQPALLGVVVHHQAVVFQNVSGVPNVLSSNGLALQIGSF